MAGAPGGPPREDGFTLLELVIALVVISVGVAGLFGVLTTAFKSTAIDIHRVDATAVASRALAQLEVAADPTSGPLAPVTRNGQTYSLSASVTPAQASNGAVDAYPALAVAVTWTDQAGAHTLTQTSARYPDPTSTSVATGCQAPVLQGTPTYNSPISGDPSLDVSWVEPTGGASVTGWRVQVSPDGGTTWTTAVADEPPLAPGTTHQVEIGGLAAADTYTVLVVAESSCGEAPFPQGSVPATPAAVGSSCTPGSFTLGPAVVTRSATGPPPGILTGDISVVVTSPVACPTGFSISTITTTAGGGIVVGTVLTQSSSGSYSYVGTLPGATETWDLGMHQVDLYAGPSASGTVIGTAALCVEQEGTSTC
jgi:prepilin-type N-terminal cleavage/methylation domain-containing protein